MPVQKTDRAVRLIQLLNIQRPSTTFHQPACRSAYDGAPASAARQAKARRNACAVTDPHQQGVKIRAIARQLKMGCAIVRRYLNAEDILMILLTRSYPFTLDAIPSLDNPAAKP